jgi:hypothetical protein
MGHRNLPPSRAVATRSSRRPRAQRPRHLLLSTRIAERGDDSENALRRYGGARREGALTLATDDTQRSLSPPLRLGTAPRTRPAERPMRVIRPPLASASTKHGQRRLVPSDRLGLLDRAATTNALIARRNGASSPGNPEASASQRRDPVRPRAQPPCRSATASSSHPGGARISRAAVISVDARMLQPREGTRPPRRTTLLIADECSSTAAATASGVEQQLRDQEARRPGRLASVAARAFWRRRGRLAKRGQEVQGVPRDVRADLVGKHQLSRVA